ncbi:MAG: 16S rRNA (adenine(1518)-N(6)/adenine(1519)-N(6))-dimethyltransferase RsmA, partial [Phycisphaerae bacterium]|nr:16S rRNA (adenine(1518)-N(6)/adenine(1519)-N(6))-dimethyltransferase RsmA [Phycisphaerae bacterium]
IKSMLHSAGLRPRRRLGQNFLHDANQMVRILEAAELQAGQTILEVGPGTGALSELILEADARLVAVEVDRGLCEILRDRLADHADCFQLIEGDVLAGKHALSLEVSTALTAAGPFSLVANLPYAVACPLLVILFSQWPAMDRAVAMVQQEVAERLLASPGGRDFGPLTVMIQAFAHVESIASLPPTCFWPQPQVTSTVLRLRRRAQPLTTDPQGLRALLQRLFSRRRKQIGSILGRDHPLPEGVRPDMRPEQLSVEQLIDLSGRLD